MCVQLHYQGKKSAIYVEVLILTFLTVSNYNYIYGFAKPAANRRLARNDENTELASIPRSAMTQDQIESAMYSGPFEAGNPPPQDDFGDVLMPEAKHEFNIELDSKERGSRIQLRRRVKTNESDDDNPSNKYKEDSEGMEELEKPKAQPTLQWD